jgi:hypothetical protein
MCPICGLSLNLDDLQMHLELELESLEKLNRLAFLKLFI